MTCSNDKAMPIIYQNKISLINTTIIVTKSIYYKIQWHWIIFRLEAHFEIETNDDLCIIKEIDKLRKYLPNYIIKEPWIIDYDKVGEWLCTSFDLYNNGQYDIVQGGLLWENSAWNDMMPW